MSPRNWDMRLEDILCAIERVQSYIADMSYSEWCEDQKTIDAVIRNLEIIGEAAKNMPDDVTNLVPDIPWGYMRGMRNLLAHEYFGVDNEIVWKTAVEDLPTLKEQIQNIEIDRR